MIIDIFRMTWEVLGPTCVEDLWIWTGIVFAIVGGR